MTGPEAYADAEKQPASPGLGLDPDPRSPAGWWDELVDTPAAPVSGRLLGILLAALSAALVAGLLGFAAGRISAAAPRSAAPAIEAWHPIEASQFVSGPVASHPADRKVPGGDVSPSPSTIGNGAASNGDAPDPNSAGAIGTALVSGTATWFDDGPGLYAAVNSYRWGDPRYKVRVCNRADACVTVTVRDFCGCPGNRVIDLSPAAFAKLAPLSRGVIPVTVEQLRGGPTVTPPATDR